MKSSSSNNLSTSQGRNPGNARPLMRVLLFFVLGIGTGLFAYNYFQKPASRTTAAEADGPKQLSESTRALLQKLSSPVELRFYSVLHPSATKPLPEFSARVDALLSEFARESNGKIRVVRSTSPTEAAADAASADGIRSFNIDKGDACFLGITIASNDRKESIPQLAPEWEQALEFDLGRAIARVVAVVPGNSALAQSVPTGSSAIQKVQALPDFQTLSVEEGKRILQEQALAEFKSVGAALELQVEEAQRRLGEAQKSGSEAERLAARQHLQDLQASQAEQLQQIAIELQDQVAALVQLKGGASSKGKGAAPVQDRRGELEEP